MAEFPAEFLNSLHPSGMPEHDLRLKVGAPIILLRNISPPALCNGTRLIVKRIQSHVLEAKISTGKFAGSFVFIPRIPIISSDDDFPFQFKRLQFPVKLCFAMSINRSQGQTLQKVGLNLEDPCFAHGQLYVALSRVGSKENAYVLPQTNQLVRNVVYKEVL